MSIVSGIVVYLLLWWTVVFCVLPFGMNPIKGNEGLPHNPKILQKALITTLISGILWVVIYVLIDHHVISFFDMAEHMATQDFKTEQQK
ncbi:MAG: DUF1467 family protein [Pseudomonadota bacterium]